MGPNRVRFETSWYKHHDDTPAYIRAPQAHCSKSIAELEFFKKRDRCTARMDECTLIIQVPISTLDKILLKGLIAGGTGRKRGRTDMSFVSPCIGRKAKRYLIENVVSHSLFLKFTTSGKTDAICEIDLVQAQEMCLKFNQTFSCAVVQFGDIPAEGNARVVGHDQTILYQRPSDVAPSAPAIQADFRASGDGLLDQDHCQKRLDPTGIRVHFVLQSPNKDESTKELLQYQQKGT